MELPSNPSNILYGIYNRLGEDVTRYRTPEQRAMVHALSDPSDFSYEDDGETLFGITYDF